MQAVRAPSRSVKNRATVQQVRVYHERESPFFRGLVPYKQMVRDMIPAKHVNEFARDLRNARYEHTDAGVYFPRAKVCASGVFEVSRNNGAFDVWPNLVVKEGRNALVNALRGGTLAGAWFVAPFENNTAVGSTLTAATFASTQGEFTNYSEATRPAWTTVVATDGALTNTAAPATTTIGAGGQKNVYGAGLLSNSGKSSTSGVLLCAALAITPKLNLEENETLGFRYTFSLLDS